jgi:hypothetical protein
VVKIGDRVPGFELILVRAVAHRSFPLTQAGGGTVVLTDSRCIVFS